MSLLNDMLRDLSQRQPVADGTEGYDDMLLQSSSITQQKKSPWLQLVVFFLVIFFLVTGIHFAWSAFSHKNSVAHASQTQPQKAVPNEVLLQADDVQKKQVNATAVNVPNNSAATATNTITPTQNNALTQKTEDATNTELQNHINDLLQQADRAMGMDRLTAPVEDNAYSYYQKILGMNPNNEDAKEGLDKIAARYLLKAQEQTSSGNSQAAEALIQRARFVSARYVLAHEVNQGEIAETSVKDLPGKDFTVQRNAESNPEKIQMQSSASPTQETIKPFVVAEAPTVSVAPNAGWKDEQLALHAQELISQGKQTEAQSVLKKFVAEEKAPALSAALLADVYLQQGNTTAASVIAEQASYLPVDVKTKLNAQILSAEGDDAKAITVLEKNLNTADTNESYRALLASLYHKTANYQQSIISYQRLINTFGDKPAYWLGLALAYDGLSQHKSALQAYQRLREYPQIQEQVKQYTDKRIAALRSE